MQKITDARLVDAFSSSQTDPDLQAGSIDVVGYIKVVETIRETANACKLIPVQKKRGFWIGRSPKWWSIT